MKLYDTNSEVDLRGREMLIFLPFMLDKMYKQAKSDNVAAYMAMF